MTIHEFCSLVVIIHHHYSWYSCFLAITSFLASLLLEHKQEETSSIPDRETSIFYEREVEEKAQGTGRGAGRRADRVVLRVLRVVISNKRSSNVLRSSRIYLKFSWRWRRQPSCSWALMMAPLSLLEDDPCASCSRFLSFF